MKAKKNKKSAWLEKVDEYISANLADPHLTATQIASAVYTSERHFYRRIRQCTGKTPNQYLQIHRLERARELLESNEFMTVKEIANKVGYARSDYFSRLYQSRYGIRPSQYFLVDI